MPLSGLTLMAVHAHPDDEALFTGGVLARYSAAGVRTVVVTCTDGALGDLGGSEGRQLDFADRTDAVARQRRAELEASCHALGVAHLEMLGYHDSGMAGWPENDHPEAFCGVAVETAAGRLAELIAHYGPQVLVTYGADGFYGHPDHIQAHRVTVAACELSASVARLYFVAIPKSRLARFVELARAAGIELPDWVEGEPAFGTEDELVTIFVDCAPFVDAKYAALAAHASQVDNTFFLDLGPELFGQIFSVESFVPADGRPITGALEEDLFAGIMRAGPT